MKIESGNFKEFRVDFAEAMKAVEEKHGLKIGIGNISYNATQFTSKITVVESDGTDRSVEDIKYEDAYKKSCQLFGLELEWLGAEFEGQGKSFKVIGLNTRASKRPVVCSCAGQQYVFPADTIIRKLGDRTKSKRNTLTKYEE